MVSLCRYRTPLFARAMQRGASTAKLVEKTGFGKHSFTGEQYYVSKATGTMRVRMCLCARTCLHLWVQCWRLRGGQSLGGKYAKHNRCVCTCARVRVCVSKGVYRVGNPVCLCLRVQLYSRTNHTIRD